MKPRSSEGDSSSNDRFFVEALPTGEGEFDVSGDEATHISGSRRLRAGQTVTLFDGSGWDLSARIVKVDARRVTLEPLTRRFTGPATPVPIICATAIPKGAREDILVSKCAELGVSRLIPISFERSVVDVQDAYDRRRDRFRRLVIEAAKQSGASLLMEVAEPIGFMDLLNQPATGLRVFGMPQADRAITDVLSDSWPFEQLLFVVGPEGGITDAEAAAAIASGFVPARLSSTILRIETAALAFAAVSVAFVCGKAVTSVRP